MKKALTAILAGVLISFTPAFCSEVEFQTKNIQPTVLYHGSPVRGIKTLKPKQKRTRKLGDGAVVFASPYIGFAAQFINRVDDRGSCGCSFGDGPFCFICNAGAWKDFGGSIYEVPVDGFSFDPNKGRGRREWTSREKVRTLKETRFESAKDAMIENNVQLFFVDDATFKDVAAAREELRKGDPDKLAYIICQLKSENERMGKNAYPVVHADYEKELRELYEGKV